MGDCLDDVLRAQARDLVVTDAELREDLVRVLAEQRRGRPNGTRRRPEFDRDADLAQQAEGGMLDLDEHGSRGGLWRLERGQDIGDRAAWDVGRGQGGEPRIGGASRETLGEQLPQGGTGRDTVAVRREPRIRGEVRSPERCTQALQPLRPIGEAHMSACWHAEQLGEPLAVSA